MHTAELLQAELVKESPTHPGSMISWIVWLRGATDSREIIVVEAVKLGFVLNESRCHIRNQTDKLVMTKYIIQPYVWVERPFNQPLISTLSRAYLNVRPVQQGNVVF